MDNRIAIELNGRVVMLSPAKAEAVRQKQQVLREKNRRIGRDLRVSGLIRDYVSKAGAKAKTAWAPGPKDLSAAEVRSVCLNQSIITRRMAIEQRWQEALAEARL